MLPEKTAVTLDYRINPDGSYTVFDHRQTILTGAPGEQIFPVLETDSHYYILSEKDVPFRALYKVDKKTYQTEKISRKIIGKPVEFFIPQGRPAHESTGFFTMG